MREAVHVAGVFESRLRKHGREAQDLGAIVSRMAGDELGHPVADIDEDAIEPVDARYSALDHQTRADKLGEEGQLLGRTFAVVGHGLKPPWR